MARDRTARTRIRQLLASNGPVSDPSGFATGLLKDHVDYEGTPVAFIQLIAAMEQDGEITREIRGKRTYKISATPSTRNAFKTAKAPVSGGASEHVAVVPTISIDYEKLSKALLQELWSVVSSVAAAGEGATSPAPVSGPSEDVYVRRIEAARAALDDLFNDVESRSKAATSRV